MICLLFYGPVLENEVRYSFHNYTSFSKRLDNLQIHFCHKSVFTSSSNIVRWFRDCKTRLPDQASGICQQTTRLTLFSSKTIWLVSICKHKLSEFNDRNGFHKGKKCKTKSFRLLNRFILNNNLRYWWWTFTKLFSMTHQRLWLKIEFGWSPPWFKNITHKWGNDH